MIRKRSIDIYGHATSITLEDEFWDALVEIARKKKISLRSLILTIDNARTKLLEEDPSAPLPNLSSSIRVYVLTYYRSLI